jgi:hypothetical protein
MEKQRRNRLAPCHSVRDTRIFSEQISQSSVTQGNPRVRNVTDFRPSRFSWVTVGDPGLGTKGGTWGMNVCFTLMEAGKYVNAAIDGMKMLFQADVSG